MTIRLQRRDDPLLLLRRDPSKDRVLLDRVSQLIVRQPIKLDTSDQAARQRDAQLLHERRHRRRMVTANDLGFDAQIVHHAERIGDLRAQLVGNGDQRDHPQLRQRVRLRVGHARRFGEDHAAQSALRRSLILGQ